MRPDNEWQDRSEGVYPRTPRFSEEENQRPEIHGLDTNNHEGWMPRTVKYDVVLRTTKCFHHKSFTMEQSQFPAHSEGGISEHAREGNYNN